MGHYATMGDYAKSLSQPTQLQGCLIKAFLRLFHWIDFREDPGLQSMFIYNLQKKVLAKYYRPVMNIYGLPKVAIFARTNFFAMGLWMH